MPLETQAVQIETPSGKGAADENFPVGSWLLPATLRPHVALFYAFARAIDDIADNPHLGPKEKVERLEGFAAAIRGQETTDPAYGKAHRLRASLAETGVTPQHCLDLITAFKRDATTLRYRSWGELIRDYCMLSAAPVGRYLLDLHGEDRSGYPASDALCNALQVINHLQDCRDDFRKLDRVYLPLDWLEDAGESVAAIEAPRASIGLRRVIDQCLDGTEALMAQARLLPRQLRHRRLAYESGAIVALAFRLIAMLRRRDPIAERVELAKPSFLAVAAWGVFRTIVEGPQHSGSAPRATAE
ncbi:MAG TPA: squalene synthase HpnC [Alphaproteobacteria bacterium]|nr:squalene synthase HpnC [Alphaproteobacteria bacterium]